MSNTPARIDPTAKPVWTPPPPQPAYDLGWTLMLIGGIAVMLSSWLLYDLEGPAMWSGYISDLAGIVVLGACCWARTTLPLGPAIALGLLSGIGLLVMALTHLNSNNDRVDIPEIACGALIIIGAGLMTTRSRPA